MSVKSWWRMPIRLYDEPEELADWARQAVAVAAKVRLKNVARKTRTKKKAAKPQPKPRTKHPVAKAKKTKAPVKAKRGAKRK